MRPLSPHPSTPPFPDLNDVLPFETKMFGRSQQMPVIGIDHAESCLGSRSQMNGIGRAQKHGGRQFLINLPDARKNVVVLRQPTERSGFDVRPYLADNGGIGCLPDGPFAQLAMERSNHLGLAMGCACHVVGRCQCANRIGTPILVIKPDQIARVEVDHRAKITEPGGPALG
jgi:hypothetical protein